VAQTCNPNVRLPWQPVKTWVWVCTAVIPDMQGIMQMQGSTNKRIAQADWDMSQK
jgi:hypothetical protein